jgi:hypothetical protein
VPPYIHLWECPSDNQCRRLEEHRRASCCRRNLPSLASTALAMRLSGACALFALGAMLRPQAHGLHVHTIKDKGVTDRRSVNPLFRNQSFGARFQRRLTHFGGHGVTHMDFDGSITDKPIVNLDSPFLGTVSFERVGCNWTTITVRSVHPIGETFDSEPYLTGPSEWRCRVHKSELPQG